MEMKQLEIFACVSKTLSFSKAAEALYISQPTVSACISALEKELGVQLFIRNTKEVSLTKAGDELLQYAQKILSLREQALHSVSGENREAPGFIDIVASTIPAQHLLPEMIARFQHDWPNIVFRVDQADSRQVEKEMAGFRYDFGMMGTLPNSDRLIHAPIYDDELVLVLPKSTKNDVKYSVKEIREGFAEYIRQVPILMREAGSGTRTEMEALLSQMGIEAHELRPCAYFSDTQSIVEAVARGMGVSLVSKVAAALHVSAGRLQMVEMGSPLFRRQIHLLHHKERWLSPVQAAFADFAAQFYHRDAKKGTKKSIKKASE